MKIAIIGSGIAGMVSARLLSRRHDVTIFEKNDYVGGHTNTVEVERGDRVWPVDTGFIVFNERTYPNFCRLLDRLGVASLETTMSFGVRDDRTGLEYRASDLGTFFAQRRNLLSPGFYRMLRDIIRFRWGSDKLAALGDSGLTLGEYLCEEGYSREFAEQFIVPMGAAIWSTDVTDMRDFPAAYFARFLDNHGMLDLFNQPIWRVIEGGSYVYARALTAPFRDRIRLRTPVESIRRHADHVTVTARGAEAERFDEVVLACHADEALAMLSDATDDERAVVGAFRYAPNEAVLHTDTRVMPQERRAWAAWNYRVLDRPGPVPVTYDMNELQRLDAPERFLVTLNPADSIAPDQVVRRIQYAHPVYTTEAVQAQRQFHRVSGRRHTHFCGAYWGYGFHEDGVKSALAVGAHFGEAL